jgi:hypothetical protein
LAGGEGFEPSTPNLGVHHNGSKYYSSITPLRLINESVDMEINFDDYKVFLSNKYTNKQYARAQLSNAIKYSECLENPSKLLSFPASQQSNILKAMVCLSKYLGCYEEYKAKLKSYDIKWSNEDTAFNGFLAIFNHKHDTLPDYIKEIQPLLHDNEKLFLRFLAITGLRKSEGLHSFNMIIDLNSEGKLSEYYNQELQVLEHFKYGKVFLRGTKNAYISFVSKEMIDQICNSEPVTYNAIHCRFMRKNIKLRLKELRSYNNTYMRKNGVLSELVDVLAGRVPKTVFCRHYLAETMKAFSNQVLSIQRNLESTLF